MSDAKSVVAFDDDDFALGNEAAIDEQIDGFLDAAVEFDDRAGAKFNDVLEQHLPGSEAQGRAQFDIQKKIEIAIAGLRNSLGGHRALLGCAMRLLTEFRIASSMGCDCEFGCRNEAHDVELELERSPSRGDKKELACAARRNRRAAS